MASLTLATELSKIASTQYKNFHFTGFMELNGKHVGVSSDGVYELNETETDDGASISTETKLPVSDFGDRARKRLRKIEIAGEFDGEVELTVISDEDTDSGREFTCAHDNDEGRQASADTFIDRDGIGRYWQLHIKTYGPDFSIDDILVKYIRTRKKPRDR